MIKVGLIGCGKIGQVRHLPEYAANPNCKITALYDINLTLMASVSAACQLLAIPFYILSSRK